jgi:hypothetical protein
MVAVNAVLIATAFGLYYAGSDTLRPWISDLHIVVGIVLPLALLVHVWRGRRTRQRISRRSGHWSADEDMRQQMRVPIPQERNTL